MRPVPKRQNSNPEQNKGEMPWSRGNGRKWQNSWMAQRCWETWNGSFATEMKIQKKLGQHIALCDETSQRDSNWNIFFSGLFVALCVSSAYYFALNIGSNNKKNLLLKLYGNQALERKSVSCKHEKRHLPSIHKCRKNAGRQKDIDIQDKSRSQGIPGLTNDDHSNCNLSEGGT